MKRRSDAMTLDPLIQRINALTGFTNAAGVQVVFAEAGQAHLSVARKPELLQFNGFFHGGVIAGLADHAAGAAATSALPAGKIAVTVDLHVNFLAPANGPSLLVKARALQVGGTLCVVTVEVTTPGQQAEILCAVATVTLRAVDLPKLPA
jgi:uncharacterized protein (TIGR00369 family)